MKKILLALASAFLAVGLLGPLGIALANKPPHRHGEDGLISNLDVSIAVIAVDNPHIDVTVTNAVIESVERAIVVLTITDVSDGSVFALKRKTDSDGVAHFEKKGNSGSEEEAATFIIDATATKDDASGTDCLVVSLDGSGNFSIAACAS